MTTPSTTLSVVVPVFNSAAALPALLERLTPVLAARGGPFEVLLVDDGSRDASWQVITELAATRPWLRGLNLVRNYGQHNALLCGVRAATGALVVTLDDDLQNPPEEIPALLAKLAEGFDVVYGAPRQERHGLLRDLASRITKLTLQRAMGVESARSVSAFRAFRTSLRDAFARYEGPFVSLDVLLTWGTQRFAAVTVQHDARRTGASQYTLGKLLAHAFNMLTGYSVVPLQLASWLGFATTLFGLAVLAFVLGRYLLHGAVVPGFAFLASIITIFAGAQLTALGIIGEYLARMHHRIMDRPSYTVRETIAGGGT